MMTLREQIAQGENIALEFKEARPKDALKFVKAVFACRTKKTCAGRSRRGSRRSSTSTRGRIARTRTTDLKGPFDMKKTMAKKMAKDEVELTKRKREA